MHHKEQNTNIVTDELSISNDNNVRILKFNEYNPTTMRFVSICKIGKYNIFI